MKKIILSLLIAALGLSTLSAAVGDTIIDITFDANYHTEQGWAVWSTPLLTGNLSFISPNKDPETETVVQIQAGPLFAFVVNVNGDDTWLTYEATGLEIGADYMISSSVQGTNNGNTEANIAIDGWTDAPVTQYAYANASLENFTKATTMTPVSKTMTATAETMTFGIAIGKSTSSTRSDYYYNLRVGFGNFSIIKSAPEYAISYHHVGTKNTENPSTYTEAEGLVSLAAPADSTGYTFAGWFTDAAFTNAVASPAIATGETTPKVFYAKWDAAATYTVTYDANGGVDGTISSEMVNGGGNPSLTGNPTRAGYNFTVWTSDMAGDGDIITTADVIDADVTFYAQWELIPLLDTILNVTYDNAYILEQGWATWDKIYVEGATAQTKFLPTGYSYIAPNKDPMVNDMIQIQNVGLPNEARGFAFIVNATQDDSWLTYTATGLKSGQKYNVKAIVGGCGNGNTDIDFSLLAWEVGSVPPTKYVKANALLQDVNKADAVDKEMSITFTASASSMVVGLGVGQASSNDRADYNYNMRALIGAWSIIKDKGTVTALDAKVANESFSLYPNPSNHVINISGLEVGVSIELYNTAGRLVKSSMDKSIDVSDLSQGVYYVKAGNSVQSFIKQ